MFFKYVQLTALALGAPMKELQRMQASMRTIVTRYHGRIALFEWMFLQIEQAVFGAPATPYAEFIVKRGYYCTEPAWQQHTRDFLKSTAMGRPAPPLAFYKKIRAKNADNAALLAKIEPFLAVSVASDWALVSEGECAMNP